MSINKKTTKVEIRIRPSEKASWQAEADEQHATVSELVRQRMRGESAPTVTVDPQAEAVQSLRSWLDLADSDGVVDQDQLAEWRAFAADHQITFAELLRRVVIDVNARYLA